MQVELRQVDWPLATPFRIAYDVWTHAQTVVVEIKGPHGIARGEGVGVSYHGETPQSLLAQLAEMREHLIRGISREELQALMAPGGARNAFDCALWDLEAKRTGRRVWDLAGIRSVAPLTTAFTLGIDTPRAMGRSATAAAHCAVLKLKLAGDEDDLARVTSVRTARPDARIIVDANQSWKERHLHELTPRLADLQVALIEQPLPVAGDAALLGFRSPVPLCADESCQTTESLPSLIGKYDYINIKLDKTGGLTEALRLARAAQAENLQLMVGCMAGSSLSMAPAFVVGQLCSVVDLDGPLLATSDVPHGIRYEGSHMHLPVAELWG